MAAIYDKALKRKDFSGIVDKDAAKKTDPHAISTFPGSPPHAVQCFKPDQVLLVKETIPRRGQILARLSISWLAMQLV